MNPSTTPAGKGRILVVDDDRLVLATVVHGLTQAGYDVVDADNGDDAILLAREHRPELALLDIRMEGKSGFDVAETLRAPSYRVPFMFLSAFADDQTLAKVQELGALDYLTKPLEVSQILPRVAEVLARVRAGASGAQAAAAPTPTPAAIPTPPQPPAQAVDALPADTLSLAVGVLMHRHSLTRAAAWKRLQQMASDQGLVVTAQAERLLAAVEELARTAG